MHGCDSPIVQTLNENPFLSSTSLWKNVEVSEDFEVEPVITATELTWKESDEAKEAMEGSAFFEVRYSLTKLYIFIYYSLRLLTALPLPLCIDCSGLRRPTVRRKWWRSLRTTCTWTQ